jgi:hypothetical protein
MHNKRVHLLAPACEDDMNAVYLAAEVGSVSNLDLDRRITVGY